jgi:hypothetical protein
MYRFKYYGYLLRTIFIPLFFIVPSSANPIMIYFSSFKNKKGPLGGIPPNGPFLPPAFARPQIDK